MLTVTENSLCQMVDMVEVPTRDKYITSNDLLLTGNKSIVHNVEVRNKFGTSDHNHDNTIKHVKTDIQLFTAPITSRKVLLGAFTYTPKEFIV